MSALKIWVYHDLLDNDPDRFCVMRTVDHATTQVTEIVAGPFVDKDEAICALEALEGTE